MTAQEWLETAEKVVADCDRSKLSFQIVCNAAAIIRAQHERIEMLERAVEEYLGRIADPVWWMQEDLIREGRSRSELNGAMAISLSNNAAYLRDIARAALRQLAEEGK